VGDHHRDVQRLQERFRLKIAGLEERYQHLHALKGVEEENVKLRAEVEMFRRDLRSREQECQKSSNTVTELEGTMASLSARLRDKQQEQKEGEQSYQKLGQENERLVKAVERLEAALVKKDANLKQAVQFAQEMMDLAGSDPPDQAKMEESAELDELKTTVRQLSAQLTQAQMAARWAKAASSVIATSSSAGTSTSSAATTAPIASRLHQQECPHCGHRTQHAHVRAEGQAAEGQAAEGQAAEGQAEGQAAEGQTAEGQTAEGQAAEGQAAGGQAAGGNESAPTEADSMAFTAHVTRTQVSAPFTAQADGAYNETPLEEVAPRLEEIAPQLAKSTPLCI